MLGAGHERIVAHIGLDECVLALEEPLRPHATGRAALGGVEAERRQLRRSVLGTGQRVGIAGDREHDGAMCGFGHRALIIGLRFMPCHLRCRHDSACQDRASLGKADASHAGGRAPLWTHQLGVEGQQ